MKYIRYFATFSFALFATFFSMSAQEYKAALPLFGKALHPVIDIPRSELDTLRIELGRLLYHEKRLSRDNSISCNSCHDTRTYGVDGKRFSVGFDNHLTGRNSPSSFNAFMHISQFWDGRAARVEEQAKGPILAEGEMAMPSATSVVEKLNAIRGYEILFSSAFPDSKPPITYDNVGTAIGAYERLFVTPGRFDRFLAGEDSALNEDEKKGLTRFVANGCVTCHSGTLLGGGLYQKLGLIKAWHNQKDQGRYDLTKNEADRMFFKVPSLRNVAKTAPYFHDGSADTLEKAIMMMGQHQLGIELSQADVKLIKAFLECLTGELDERVAAPPTSFP